MNQEKRIEERVDTTLTDSIVCDSDLHTQLRRVLGQISWLQSSTQFQSCYPLSRCASAAAAATPTSR
eukprot:7410543-Prorocentrum_lima.AAC.1